MNTFRYQWKIPTTIKSHFDLLCSGYIRHEIASNILIKTKDLCANYLYNDDILNEIKTAEPGQAFCSPIIYHAFCKWIINFYPRGSRANYDANCEVSLVLLSLSPKIDSIECKCSVSVPELNFSDHDDNEVSFSSYRMNVNFRGRIERIQQIQTDLKELTFNLEINILNIQDSSWETLPIDNIFQNVSTKHITDCFKWTMDTTKSEAILFTMHSFSWCIELGTSSIGLRLMSSQNRYVYIHYDLICKDTGFRQTDFLAFDSWSSFKGIMDKSLIQKNLKKVKLMTMELMITMIDIFDGNGNNITNKYIDNPQPSQPPLFKHHQWRIPQISTNEAILFCNGYAREQCVNDHIPYDIIQVIVLFFVNGRTVIAAVQNAKNTKGFKGDIFEVGGFKWFCDLYPRGYDMYSRTIELYLNLASLSPNISIIRCWYKWRMREMNAFNEERYNFEKGSLSTNIASTLVRVDDIQKLQTLTFEIDLYILDVLDENGVSLDNYRIYQDVNMVNKCRDSFKWIIDKESMKNDENVISNVFNMHSLKWKLELMKNEEYKMKLSLISLPSNIIIWIDVILQIEDDDISFGSGGVELCEANMYEIITLSKEFEKERDITFKLIIELMDVYHDENGYCITQQFWKQNQLKVMNK